MCRNQVRSCPRLILAFALIAFLFAPLSGLSAFATQATAEVYIDPKVPSDLGNQVQRTISSTISFAQRTLGRTRVRPFRAFILPTLESLHLKWAEVYNVSVDEARRTFGTSVGRAHRGQDLWMRLDDDGIVRRQPGRLEKIVAHEAFHLIQSELEGLREVSNPVWLREGEAELVGWLVAEELGVVKWEAVKLQLQFEVSRRGLFDRLGVLKAAEAGNEFSSLAQSTGVIYSYVALGVEYLAGNDLSSIRRFREGLAAGRHWTESFFMAFGVTPGSFYERWESRVLEVKASLVPAPRGLASGQAACTSSDCMNHVPWSIGDEFTYHVIAGSSVIFEYALIRTPVWRGTVKQPRPGDPPWQDVTVVRRALHLPSRKRSTAAFTNLKVPPSFVDSAAYLDIYASDYTWLTTFLPAQIPSDWGDLRGRAIYSINRVFSWPLRTGTNFIKLNSVDHFVEISVEVLDLGEPIGKLRTFLVADRFFVGGRTRSVKRWFSPCYPLTVREEYETGSGPVQMSLVGYAPAGSPLGPSSGPTRPCS